MNKKPVMRIGLHSKCCTSNSKYNVCWGTTGDAYNNQRRVFVERKDALKFVKALKTKFKSKYKVEYNYVV